MTRTKKRYRFDITLWAYVTEEGEEWWSYKVEKINVVMSKIVAATKLTGPYETHDMAYQLAVKALKELVK